MSARAERRLTERYEAIVRLVAAQGRATLNDVLSMYRAQPLSGKALRNILDELTDRGWLTKLHDHQRGGRAVAWAATEEALPHLWRPARLPGRPDPLPGAPGAPLPRRAAARRRPAVPAAESPTPPTPPTYRLAPAPWASPPAPPLRAGALDFLAVPSLGPFPRPDLNP